MQEHAIGYVRLHEVPGRLLNTSCAGVHGRLEISVEDIAESPACELSAMPPRKAPAQVLHLFEVQDLASSCKGKG